MREMERRPPCQTSFLAFLGRCREDAFTLVTEANHRMIDIAIRQVQHDLRAFVCLFNSAVVSLAFSYESDSTASKHDFQPIHRHRPTHYPKHLPSLPISIPLIKRIPMPRRMRDLAPRVPGPPHPIRPMLIRPAKNPLKVPTPMRSPHPIDPHASQRLKRRVPRAHNPLPDVIQAMVAMEYNLLV